MRLTLSLLAAVGLHGAMFGVVAALLSHTPAKTEAPVALDVDVVPPTANPIADSAPGAAAPTPAPPRPHAPRHVREVARADNSMPLSAPSIPSAEPQASAVSMAGPPASPAGPPVAAAAAPPQQGGGAVLSAQPRYRTNPRPDYPLPSLRRREEGIVLLNVQVQADGTPAAISLNRSCGHPLLDRAALEAVRRWTFAPARAAGVPVASLVVIPVRFSLAEQP